MSDRDLAHDGFRRINVVHCEPQPGYYIAHAIQTLRIGYIDESETPIHVETQVHP